MRRSLLVVPLLFALTVWFHRASERGYLRGRDGIANVLSDLSESLYGIRVVTATNRQRHNVVHHRNVVGEYRDANLYTGRANAIYGPATLTIGILGQALILGVGGDMVLARPDADRRPRRLHARTSAGSSSRSSCSSSSTTCSSRDARRSSRLRELARDPAVRSTSSPTRPSSPPVDGRDHLRDVTFGYDPARPVLHARQPRDRPGRERRVRRADRRRQVDDGQARQPLLRPPGRPRARRRHRHPRRDAALAAHARSASCPRSRSSSPARSATTSSSRSPTATRRRGRRGHRRRRTSRARRPAPRRASTPSSTSAVRPCRRASASCSRSARAFLAHPRVLVLDEATSSLDLRSETVVEQALDALLEGRTAILIAHRLTTAQRADRIVVIDDGGIVESGSPRRTPRARRSYAAMYDAWLASGGRDSTRRRRR